MPFALGALGADGWALARYKQDLYESGKTYVPRLGWNTNLGPTVRGFPGAKFLFPGDLKYTYELAPFVVVAAERPGDIMSYPLNKTTASDQAAAMATDLGRQVAGAAKQGLSLAVDTAAGALGLSTPVLVGGLALLAFVVLRPQLAARR